MRSVVTKTGSCVLILVLIAFCIVAGCTLQPVAPPQPKSAGYPSATTIIIKNGIMNPPVLMAVRGTTVTWIDEDVPFCTIKSDPGVPDSIMSPVPQPPSCLPVHVYLTGRVSLPLYGAAGQSGAQLSCMPDLIIPSRQLVSVNRVMYLYIRTIPVTIDPGYVL